MYVVVLLGLVALGAALAILGQRRGRKRWLAGGMALAIATVAFFGLLSFWGEMLWFTELGFGRRFWAEVLGRVGVGLAGASVAGGKRCFLNDYGGGAGNRRTQGVSAKAEPGRVLDQQPSDITRVLRSVWFRPVPEKFAAGCTVTSIWRQ